MKKTWIVLGGILALLLIITLFFSGTYNTLVQLDQGMKNQWAQVESQLKRRYNLIPNLVNTVKGYQVHEKEIFTEIAEARARLAGAGTVNERVAASNGLEGAIGRLLLIVENYPNLKADQTFIRLMDELAGTENRIAVERMRFNDQVKQYNTYARQFPRVLLVSMYGFPLEKPYFQVEAEAKAVPRVNF